ncbi:MAG TPA: universal stress protein [Chloroflexia bacterium]|nr:universal stress protein [Chloroflexia bacterium]
MQAHIIVPLDGSPLAERIIPQVAPLAQVMGGTLTLLRVVPAPVIVEPIVGMATGSDNVAANWEAERAAARSYLAGARARVSAITGLPVQTAVLDGDPVTRIVEYAAHDLGAVLIAMATHGRTGLGRWVFGSVAEGVLHAAGVPLLLLRATPAAEAPGAPLPCRTIVVPVDGSPFAEYALDEAHAIARATGAALLLVAAVANPDPRTLDSGDIPLWEGGTREAGVAHMADYLLRTAERLTTAGVLVETQLGFGRPADVILHAVEESGADLVVMATHGRSGFQGLRMGSVALKVVQGTTRPVLLLRAGAIPQRTAGAIPAADVYHTEPVGAVRNGR